MKYLLKYLKLTLLLPLLIITNCSYKEPVVVTKYKVVHIKKLDYNITTDYSKGKLVISKKDNDYIVPVEDLDTFFRKYKHLKDMNLYKDTIIHSYEDIIDRHNSLF